MYGNHTEVSQWIEANVAAAAIVDTSVLETTQQTVLTAEVGNSVEASGAYTTTSVMKTMMI